MIPCVQYTIFSKKTFSMNLLYKYVELNNDIYLWFIIFCLSHLYNMKDNSWILLPTKYLYIFVGKIEHLSIQLCKN